MTRDDERDTALERTLRRMGTAVVPVEAPGVAGERRERLVRELTAFADGVFEARARTRPRRVRVVLAACVFAAAACIAGLAALRLRAAPPATARMLSHDGTVEVGADGAPGAVLPAVPFSLRDRDRVETREGHAEVRLVSGASVDVEPMTRLELERAARTDGHLDEQVALPSGRIKVRVPKLAPGSRLVVNTPNAVVTVHGTAFVVEVTPERDGTAAETHVAVTEGRVSVASGGREVFLDPGANWSSAAASPVPTPAAAAPEPAPPGAAPGADSGTPHATAARRSTLADQNELFRAALDARRRGDPRRAVDLVDRLLAKYPGSPLAAEARAERDRARADLERAMGR